MPLPLSAHLPAYRGRIAPTPSGWLHLGHAATFHLAHHRARASGGTLIYRCEDIDPQRCKPVYITAAMEDLKWIGLDWDEGPVLGGPHSPYAQSERLRDYLKVLDFLWSIDLAYPSPHSRKEIIEAGSGSVGADGESLFPEKLRQPKGALPPSRTQATPWRLRVPPCQPMNFVDGRLGPQSFTAGKDFGDFLLWRREGVPAYELAVVVDDIAMKITEVVRGEDLLLSTARQLLIYEALQAKSPDWYHAPLLKDPQSGQRLAKTHHSLGLRQLRESGKKVAFPAPGTPQVSL